MTANYSKSDMQRQIESQIKHQQERLADIETLPIDVLQGAFPEGKWEASMWDIDFKMPYDFSTIALIKWFLTDVLGWEERQDRRWINYGKAYWAITYKAPISDNPHRPYFDVFACNENDGSTCVLKQIDTELKETPVYEVICKEGALEAAL